MRQCKHQTPASVCMEHTAACLHGISHTWRWIYCEASLSSVFVLGAGGGNGLPWEGLLLQCYSVLLSFSLQGKENRGIYKNINNLQSFQTSFSLSSSVFSYLPGDAHLHLKKWPPCGPGTLMMETDSQMKQVPQSLPIIQMYNLNLITLFQENLKMCNLSFPLWNDQPLHKSPLIIIHIIIQISWCSRIILLL